MSRTKEREEGVPSGKRSERGGGMGRARGEGRTRQTKPEKKGLWGVTEPQPVRSAADNSSGFAFTPVDVLPATAFRVVHMHAAPHLSMCVARSAHIHPCAQRGLLCKPSEPSKRPGSPRATPSFELLRPNTGRCIQSLVRDLYRAMTRPIAWVPWSRTCGPADDARRSTAHDEAHPNRYGDGMTR